MKRLSVLLVLALLLLSACSKESVKAEYIVVASGQTYNDNIYITYNSKMINQSTLIKFSNAEAVVKAHKKDYLKLNFPAWNSNSIFSNKQKEGDIVHIDIYRKRVNGTKGAKVGEIDLPCGSVSDTEKSVIKVEW